ncbi:hypothetical protein VTJ49DRAFT_5438 [Mycothermus thermophilus]|uniref:Vacuolar fusion protein MON1 n=1 Tax=Humicola insolens TaxID=85995 RepID=A0ABR3VLW3_HUMIN
MVREAEAETTSDGPENVTPDKSAPPDPPPSPPPPPLPPRRILSTEGAAQSKPTTAVSSIDIATLSFPDGSRGTFITATQAVSTPSASGYVTPSRDAADLTDAMSIMSFAPTMRPPGDLASLVAGGLNRKSRAWNLLRAQAETVQPFESIELGAPGDLAGFEHEFDDIPADQPDDVRMAIWKSKMKHYMILSSAGKPIYSRHGDLSLVNGYMGVVQTIISFYEGAKNPLLGFTAGNVRFVIAIEGPLYFVAISKLGESDAQLRNQLEALYMQILSTLTLPMLQNIFAHRPSTDLRKPLEGTESLLSSLADSFTRGSPSTLLGALECLRLRKSQRHAITSVFLKNRSEKLLYGLIVAGGRLVSVIRPRKHSLHPSDLQLIFNMLFESGNIKAGGGESWIPLCLPAFNNRGYLYMYVSFFDDESLETDPGAAADPDTGQQHTEAQAAADDIALILISPDKESFYDLKEMRDKFAAQLTKAGHLALIRSAAREGRSTVQSVAPGAQIAHFLYKSRANVQFCMSSLDSLSSPPPEPPVLTSSPSQPPPPTTAPTSIPTTPESLLTRRRLMTLYHDLHAAAHAKHAHLRVLHAVADDAASLAWITPVFELYCVAGPNVSRAAMAQGANRVAQWARREEERLFIIGGGVF